METKPREEMTPSEKQKDTMRRKKEQTEKRLAERAAEWELIRKNLIAVLQSEDTEPETKLESSRLLLEMDFRIS